MRKINITVLVDDTQPPMMQTLNVTRLLGRFLTEQLQGLLHGKRRSTWLRDDNEKMSGLVQIHDRDEHDPAGIG
jgi:hypothetical protein